MFAVRFTLSVSWKKRSNIPLDFHGGQSMSVGDLYRSHDVYFGDVGAAGTLEDARVVVVSAPLEYTVCYGKGTAEGPAAIIAASSQMELFDETLDTVPAEQGIGTLAPLDFADLDHMEALEMIRAAVADVISHGQLPVVLGGEHSLTPSCIRAIQAAADYAPLGIVQFDAHADLRQEFEGSSYSHACAMRRSLDIPGTQLLGVGIRSISFEEIQDLRANKLMADIIYAHEIFSGHADFSAAIARLPERVYLTIDLDGFDPAIMPSTGTPEPGGLSWYQVIDMLRMVIATKQIVGIDVVELAPVSDRHDPDFLAAKLVYRILGMIFTSQKGGAV
jgi:agmatinase